MKTHLSLLLWICTFGLVGAPLAAVLDFEHVLGAIPTEGMAISNQFAPAFGMRFTDFQDTRFPTIIQKGPPGRLFNSPAGPDSLSTINPKNHGDFFLGDPRVDDPWGITIRFDAPVSTFSCYLLDLDTTERVIITAYASDAASSGLATNTFYATNGLPFGNSLSGLVSISTPTKQIRRVTARLLGGGQGVGFDDLSSDYVPAAQASSSLAAKMYPALTITGSVGTPYRIDYADSFDRTPTSTNWHALTTIFLPSSPYLFFDTSATNTATRFYRAVGVQ